MAERQAPARPAWQRPRGWLLATGIGLVLACAVVGWVQLRQVAMVAGAVQDERDKLPWTVYQLECGLLVLRDQLRLMIRSGFDAIQIDEVNAEGVYDFSAHEFSEFYQSASDTSDTIFQKRQKKREEKAAAAIVSASTSSKRM